MDHAGDGILLSGTSPGSPAEKAGLRAGDLILSIGGEAMPDLRAMVDLLRKRAPGDTVEVVFRRVIEEKKVKVVLGTRPGA
jgi:S1-C subfamily serine protease